MLSSHSLPSPRIPLIGREREFAAARELLLDSDVGLVTLAGTGGIGKTRLGIQVVANLLDDDHHFPDGITFIDLAPLQDPSLVASTIAHTLGIRDIPGLPLTETLKQHLRASRMLLLLETSNTSCQLRNYSQNCWPSAQTSSSSLPAARSSA